MKRKVVGERRKAKGERRINKIFLPEYFIYPVITTKFCRNMDPVATLRSVLKGGAKIVQLREKDISKEEILKLAEKFREITKRYRAKLIINDHIDIALAVKAEGVHLGQDDLPVKAAKKISKRLVIGASTHNMKEALAALRQGADYINIGPVFATNTKETGFAPLGVSEMKRISKKISVPFTVMGGIKGSSVPLLVKNGATRLAMVTEITRAKDPGKKIRELTGLLAEEYKKHK